MAAAAGVGRDQTQINQNGNDEFAGLLLDEKETEDFQQFVLQLLTKQKINQSERFPSHQFPTTMWIHHIHMQMSWSNSCSCIRKIKRYLKLLHPQVH